MGGMTTSLLKYCVQTVMCNICLYPSKKLCLSLCCGNVFCTSCLDGAKKVTISCPICRSEEFETILHKQADRAVRSLSIFCINKEKGCEWQGEIKMSVMPNNRKVLQYSGRSQRTVSKIPCIMSK